MLRKIWQHFISQSSTWQNKGHERSQFCRTPSKQRRRWGPSTTANIWELIVNRKKAVAGNAYISNGYILYQFLIMIFSLIGLSTTVLIVAEALLMAAPGINMLFGYILVIGPVVVYAILCRVYKNGETQLKLASIFSLLYSVIMALVLISIVEAAVDCPANLTFIFFASVAAIYIVASILHFDPITLLCGIIYWLLIPSGFIFLQIYSIANLNDVSWGTRSGGGGGSKVSGHIFFKKFSEHFNDHMKGRNKTKEKSQWLCCEGQAVCLRA